MRGLVSAEELLTLLSYGFDLLTAPTLSNWDQSYQGWLYSHGLLRRIERLESSRLLQREGPRGEWIVRLTAAGHTVACGGRDPALRWGRPWDGWWRQLVFDLPVAEQRARVSLLRWLRAQGFGYLQDSVWISPDPVADWRSALRGVREDATVVTVLEGRCAAGYSDAALVTGAWPFPKIQQGYRSYLDFAAATRRALPQGALHPGALFKLLRAERREWCGVFALDPLLPRTLWPDGYEGERAWRVRGELLQLLAHRSRQTRSG